MQSVLSLATIPTLFFYSVGGDRDLHSFPTRRSSDLWLCFAVGLFLLASAAVLDQVREREAGNSNTARSEEHTSELQSRQYLVCRLLLEKKNKTHHQASDQTLHIPFPFLQYS